MKLSWSSLVVEAVGDDTGDSGLVCMTVVSLLETTTTSDSFELLATVNVGSSDITDMEEPSSSEGTILL